LTAATLFPFDYYLDMMRSHFIAATALAAFAPAMAQSEADFARNFTIHNGQIYTPGLAILNAPQPGTPMGGDDLHISLDVTTNGRLPLPPYADDSATAIHNITLFLSSYRTGRNFTITNGTATADNSTYGNIMLQQEGSTVKHINWAWPDCLVGDGQPEGDDSDRGLYNVGTPGSSTASFADLPDLHPPELQAERRGPLHHLRRAHPCHQQHPRARRPSLLRLP
jgi:hypothetical protein